MRWQLLALAIGSLAGRALAGEPTYSHVVLGEFRRTVEEAPSPVACDRADAICMNVFLWVDWTPLHVFAGDSGALPKQIIGQNHYGDDPFERGVNKKYLFLLCDEYVGRAYQVARTDDGRLAIPVWEIREYDFNSSKSFVLPELERCVKSMRFSSPYSWTWRKVQKDEKDAAWANPPYSFQSGSYARPAQGVYLDDLEFDLDGSGIRCHAHGG